MALKTHPAVEISADLLEAIRSFPIQREVEHCSVRFSISPLDIYAECPQCGVRLKVRAYEAAGEIDDIFDAVCEWLNQPGAQQVAQRRQKALKEEGD